jgi:alkylhydroperoxidase/carboxymuconolactone decarboxylase family protein YurZ
MDPAWANLWVRFCYQGMYARGIVDERTRHLCMVGNCVAVGEVTQLRGHMRGALRIGVPAREVLEVIFQSSVHFGMPLMIRALQTLTQVMDESGRLGEIGNPIKRTG